MYIGSIVCTLIVCVCVEGGGGRMCVCIESTAATTKKSLYPGLKTHWNSTFLDAFLAFQRAWKHK